MLGFGLVSWIGAWLDSSPGSDVGLAVRELGLGLAGGLLFGLAVGMLTLWANRIARSPLATPTATCQSDRRTAMILALIIGLAIGLLVGLTASAVSGVALGLAATLAAWLAFGQVPLIKLTELILTCRGHGRWHFLPLLEDACDRQVLRQAGTVHQLLQGFPRKRSGRYRDTT